MHRCKTRRPSAIRRRSFLAATGLGWMQPLHAQPIAYPSRPIRVVYPFPPGGGGDPWVRRITDGMAPDLGQPVIVDHRPGAGGMLGAENVARSAPDGYTLLFTISAFYQTPIIQRRFPYDPINDFAPIGRFGLSPFFFVVGPAVPSEIGTLPQFIAWSRQRAVNLASNSPGGTGHALTALVAREVGVSATIAQYRGESLQLPDILGGRLHGGFHSTVLTPQLVRAGQVRALAVTGEQRLATLPDVPTFVELGYPRTFNFVGFSGLLAPAQTPVPVLTRLSDSFRAVATAPSTRDWLTGLGITPGYQDGPAFHDQIKNDMRDWQAMVEELGITAEG